MLIKKLEEKELKTKIKRIKLMEFLKKNISDRDAKLAPFAN